MTSLGNKNLKLCGLEFSIESAEPVAGKKEEILRNKETTWRVSSILTEILDDCQIYYRQVPIFCQILLNINLE